MAKKNLSIKLTNCNLYEDDILNIEEVSKDDTKYYNIADLLKQFLGCSVNIQISTSEDIPEHSED